MPEMTTWFTKAVVTGAAAVAVALAIAAPLQTAAHASVSTASGAHTLADSAGSTEMQPDGHYLSDPL
ncbi:hypothetical protein ACFZB9_21750 [Kitasatospora sp. NPDC008050]|uniref:hypothetical protein n=1 Tax=Kitasatospora sp. NPDC008050 TaxID=3364021 RepID=UPI0036ED12D3